MEFIFGIYFAMFFLYMIALILFMFFLKKDKQAKVFTEEPFISILIAARNEELNISHCLKAISEIHYPSSKIEVLIGNDQSTDNTASLVNDFIQNKPNFRLIDIQENFGTAKGKANVLAHLAREAKGDFFFITDADIQVPKNWISALMSNWNDQTGIVSGATMVKGNSLFETCQTLDWIYAFGMVKTVSDLNIPVSAVGNNMMISRKAYESTGGYENIPFSVTEDFQLFIETLKKGWKYKNTMNEESLAYSKPINSLGELLRQRKRWMQGAMKLPFILLLCLFLQAVFLPVVVLLFFFNPCVAIIIWIAKIISQGIFMKLSFNRIGEKVNIFKSTFLFEAYSGILSVIVLLNYFLPGKVIWKGRTY